MPCLDASQFEVLEDGVPQQISSFEAVDVSGCGPSPGASAPDVAAGPQPLARVLSTPPLVTALVFEELGDQARLAAWRAATAFVEEGRRPGEFVGVFVLELAVQTMVPYTRDKDALLDGLRRAAMRPGCPIEMPPDVESAAGPSGCTRLGGGRGTLKNLQTVADTLAHMPGRKNIVLFSEGFNVSAQDNTIDLFRRLTSDANQATVTFHSIDAAGPRLGRVKGLGRDPTAYLELVARDTGGQHVRGTNNLTGGPPPRDDGHAGLLPPHVQPDQYSARRPVSRHHRELARSAGRGDARNGYHADPRAARRWWRPTTSRRTCCWTRRNCPRTSR